MPTLDLTLPTRAAIVTMAAAFSGAIIAMVGAGCGSTTTNDPGDGISGGDGGTPSEPIVTTLYPDAEPVPGQTECKVEMVTGIHVPGASHLDFCTDITYSTNPPSGGDHWGVWAPFQRYETAVPREVYVHDMEHGAVILTYDCSDLASDECDKIVEAVDQVFSSVALDPLCATQTAIARVIMTPDPKLATPIAASAWGATYTATCIDVPSLKAFVASVYGKGTEKTCATGQYSEGLIVCDGDGGILTDAGAGGGHP